MELDNKIIDETEEENEIELRVHIGDTDYFVNSKYVGKEYVEEKIKEILLRLAEVL